MGNITTAIASAFRDFVTDGVASSGAHEPIKADIRALGPLIETAIGNAGLGALVSVTKTTMALLDADLAHAADTVALVYADATDANNDLYVKTGGSGAGSWTNTGALHSIIAGLAQPFADAAEASATAAAASAVAVAAASKTKVEAQPPLKPKVRRNALRALYSSTSGVAPSAHFGVDIPTYLFSPTVWADHGEPNVLRFSRTATGVETRPQVRLLVTPAELAAIGVVPDDTTPPQVSFRGALRLDTAVNQNITAGNDVTGQFWIVLRYNGVGGTLSGSYNASTDVILAAGAAGAYPGYLGAGDALWGANQAEVQFVAGKYKRIRRQGFKVPATYGGKALSGIFIDCYGRTVGAGTTTLDYANLALIAGASIDWDETILNPTDKVDDLASDAELATVNTAVAGKAPYSPPLKPASYQNAIPGRYSPTGSSASALPWSGSTVSAISNVWSDDVYTAYGEPNVQRVEGTAAGAAAYQPDLDIVLTATDLARVGIVPNDDSPPVISVRAAILLTGLSNQNIDIVENSVFGQLWVGLRYDGAGGSTVSGFSAARQDVVFSNANAGAHPSYYVPSPNPFSAVTGRLLGDTPRLKGYAREGIPIPATINGKAFTHLKLKIYGRSVAAGAYALNLARLAVVAGATIDDADSYVDHTDLVASAPTSAQTNLLTVQRAQKIGAIGNSFTESIYTPRGKHWLAKLSALTDYNVENFAVSGDTNVSNLGRIRSGDLTFGNRSWRDYGVTYGLVMNATNDPTYETWDEYRDDLRAMCETLRSTGAIPILASEFTTGKFGGEYQRGLQSVAAEQDALFVDITPTARNYDITALRDLELWGSGHPGVRNNELISDPITRFVNALPRPAESLKIFRKRSTVTVSTLDDLVHDSLYDRARLFREIEIGHRAMTAATEKYLDQLATGSPVYERVDSEYLKLSVGSPVSFADYGLVDAIINGTDANVSSLALLLSDPTVTVYVRDVLAAPYENSTRYERFSVGSPTASAGATYTSSDPVLPGTFTVVGISNGNLIMSPMDPNRAKLGAGTLTKVSGSGDTTIAYTAAAPGYVPDYYTNLRKPEGHWVAVSGDGSGRFTVSDLRGRLQVDRVQFLLYKAGGFDLTKCEIEYVGGGFKPRMPRPCFGPRATGAELLAETKCGTSGQLAGWTVEGSLTPGKAGDDSNGTPYGTTGYVTVTNANRLRQAFTYAADFNQAREVEIVVKARRWPSKVNSGTYPTGAGITAETFDWGQLEIALDDGALVTPIRVPVGLWWKDAIVRMTVPAFSTGMTVRIGSADTNGIQVAGGSVKFV